MIAFIFLGGAIALPAATLLAVAFTPATPFYVAAASVLLAALIILVGRTRLSRADGADVDELEEAEAIGAGDS